MVLTRQREVALAGFFLILFGKIIPTFLYETSCEAQVGFSLSQMRVNFSSKPILSARNYFIQRTCPGVKYNNSLSLKN
jgi:hypothetical protein